MFPARDRYQDCSARPVRGWAQGPATKVPIREWEGLRSRLCCAAGGGSLRRDRFPREGRLGKAAGGWGGVEGRISLTEARQEVPLRFEQLITHLKDFLG